MSDIKPVFGDALDIVAVYADPETGKPRLAPEECSDCDGTGECQTCEGEGECTECKHGCGEDCDDCAGSGNCSACAGKPAVNGEPIGYAIIYAKNFDRRIAYDREEDAQVALAALREMPVQTVASMFSFTVAA